MHRTIYLPVLILLIFVGCLTARDNQNTIRQPAVAGYFYPGDSTSLVTLVQGHLNNVTEQPDIDGQLLALIVPHAGLVYSGQIAANSYKLLENNSTNKIILCGPSHRYGFDGISVYGPGIVWKTPLGQVPCDNKLSQEFVDYNRRFRVDKAAHVSEHSLEVQLPYLQTVLNDFEIIPIIMGHQNKQNIEALSEALVELTPEKNAVMISATDWQHYHPASQGWKMDSLGIVCLENLDPDRLQDLLQTGQIEACGGGPTVAILKAAIARGADRVKILRYGDSGDITGDKSSVVSYVAAAIYRSTEGTTTKLEQLQESSHDKSEKPAFHLSDNDKHRLLEIARQSIEKYLRTNNIPEFEVNENLKQPGAAFVTLNRDNRLRGCIGHTIAQKPLYETVATCAVQAAVADPRFQPVRSEEVPKLDIEISVLTPLEKVESIEDIIVGRDGLMIFYGNNRGLLLPQVAVEYGWDRTEFLQRTCNKAGLPVDTYLSPEATIYSFRALVFGEKALGMK